MKIKNLFLRAVSVVLCIAFLCCISVTSLAQDVPVSFVLSSNESSENSDAFISKDTFEGGDIVYVKITATQIDSLGGIVFTVKFDNNLFGFMKNKSICKIEDTDGENSYYPNNENGEVLIIYESSSHDKATSITGVIYYLAFEVKEVSKNTSASFSMQIEDFYDNSSAQRDIESNKIDSIIVNLVSETISEQTLALFRKLENIKYPDSKEDIDVALAEYNSLTTAQKKFLSGSYVSEYEWLSTATTRYNRLAEQASKAALKAEVNNFKKAHSKVLAKTPKTITLADEKALTKAVNSYENLSEAAKTYLQAEGKLLPTLEERISELKDIKAEVEDFLSNETYAHIWDKKILENRFDLNYTNYLSFIQLAILNYDLLSDEAKAMVKSEHEWLLKLDSEAKKYLELDEAAALLAEKTAQFQKNHLRVFMLNQSNVSEADRTAILMVIDAYNALDDEALKKALAPRIEQLNALLEIIDELAEESSEKETVYVEVPGETKTEVVTVPGGTEYITKTETVTKTDNLTNTVIKTLKQQGTLSNIILIMFVLLAVAVFILVVSYILCEKYKKKAAALGNNGEADL